MNENEPNVNQDNLIEKKTETQNENNDSSIIMRDISLSIENQKENMEENNNEEELNKNIEINNSHDNRNIQINNTNKNTENIKDENKEEEYERETKEKERQERKERREKERQEKERLEREREEAERIERERKEKEKQERKERREKERQEKKRLERERQEIEEQERLERERLEKEEQERLEKERLENKKRRFLSANNSREKLGLRYREDSSQKYGLGKNRRFNDFVNKKEENNEGEVQDIRKKNQTLDTEKIEEENIYEKPIKTIYIRKKLNKDELSNGSKREDSEIGSKNGEEKSEYSNGDGYIYQKKKLSKTRFDDINLLERNKNEQEENKNNTISQNDNLISILSQNFREGLPTKIKIYKCVVWKNSDPTVNEESIKNFIHRSGSQLLKKGGFVMKLPQNKSFKAKHENI